MEIDEVSQQLGRIEEGMKNLTKTVEATQVNHGARIRKLEDARLASRTFLSILSAVGTAVGSGVAFLLTIFWGRH